MKIRKINLENRLVKKRKRADILLPSYMAYKESRNIKDKFKDIFSKIFNISSKSINWLYWLLTIIFLVTAATVSISVINPNIGLHLAVVESGSMTPAIRTGSVVATYPSTTYKVGDVVSFKSYDINGNLSKYTTTHRIVGTKKENNSTYFVTKGDYNGEADGDLLNPKDIIGKVIFSLPYLGFLTSFARSSMGLIFMIIIPSTLIVAGELVSIKKEIIRMFKAKGEHSYH